MDALDAALATYAASAPPPTDPLDAALAAHAQSAPTEAKTPPVPQGRPSNWDVWANGVMKGMAGFADAIPNAITNVANLGIAGYGVGKHVLTGSSDLPDLIPSDSLSGYSKIGHALGVIDDKNEPVDATGRIIDTTGQFMGGGVNPRNLARLLTTGAVTPLAQNVAGAVASGLAAGGAGEAVRGANTGSDMVDNALKTAVPMAAGMGAGGFVASRGTAGDRVAAATQGVTPQQMALARALQDRAAAAGSPVTGYEAIQSVTGLNPKMQTQQRIAEQSDASNPSGLTQMMQNRPGANAQVFGDAADSVAPANPLPDTLAGRMQTAATGAIDTARQQGNAAAAPYYARTSNDPSVRIPPADWNSLTADPAVAWALQQVQRDPLLGVQNATPGSAQWLDAAKKFLDSRSNALGQSGDRYPAGQASNAATRITGAMDPVLPDYATARGIVAQNMRDNVVPMEQSQVGKLSRSDQFPAQAETLLPNKPMDVTPQVVGRTAATLGAQDPTIMREFVSQFLRGQYNEASQQNVAGPNTFGGAKFAAQVAGNPEQEANLMAALRSSGANPQQMQEAIQIFRAQGMKPAVNSATTSNAAEGSALGGGGIGGFVKNPISNTLGLIDNWRNGGAAADLARALGAPDSVGSLAELARANGTYSPTRQMMMANLLQASKPQSSGNKAYDDYLKAYDAAPDNATRIELGKKYEASLH